MNGPRYITDCITHKLISVEPDAEFLTQQETDRVVANAQKIEEDTKMERDQKISAEMRRMAEASLVAKGEL